MSTDTVISVCQVSKRYRTFQGPWSRLRSALIPFGAAPAKEVWALRKVGFEVGRGESVGIIGRNGSGKSTLLEMIAGTLAPTSGNVVVHGRVAALLELGSGFNPEFSGRENVILNGLLLGLSRAEIEARFDDIASFADIGDVLDRPAKTYSSGMLVRLAFAVQVALEPDVLIIDEALSVGDFFFQQKCFGHLGKLRDRGTTLLFVSHDMGTVRNLCRKAVYLREGRLEYWGESDSAIRRYLSEQNQCSAYQPSCAPTPHAGTVDLNLMLQHTLWRPESADADKSRLLGVVVLDAHGRPETSFKVGSRCRVLTFFRTLPGESVNASFTLKNRFDQTITSTGSKVLGLEGCSTANNSVSAFILDLDLQIEAGDYSFQIALGRPLAANRGQRLAETDWLGPLRTTWDYENQPAPFLGMFGLPASGRFIPDAAIPGELHGY